MTDNGNDPNQLSFDDCNTCEWRARVSFETERPLDDDDCDVILGALRPVFGSGLQMATGGHDGSTVISVWSDIETAAAAEAIRYVEWALAPTFGRVTVKHVETTLVDASSGPDDDPIRQALVAFERNRAAEARGEVRVLDDDLRQAFLEARGAFNPEFSEEKRQYIRAAFCEDADIIAIIDDLGWEPGRPFFGPDGEDAGEDGGEGEAENGGEGGSS